MQRTGIRQRYVAGPDETTSSLALKAAQAALRSGGLEAADIDLVIVATSTPDYTFPAVATQVQAGLGIVEGAAFDLQAVCSGFVYAVVTAEKFLRSGSHKRALVIGAETFSRLLDWNDRTTCVLFGDGAGAIVLEARDSDGRLGSPGRDRLAAARGRPASREALRRRWPVDHRDGWPFADGRQGGVPPRGRHGDRRDPGMLRRRRRDRGRDRLVRAASGQSPHHRRFRRQARHRARQGRSSPSTSTATRPPPRSRSRSTSASRTGASSPAIW